MATRTWTGLAALTATAALVTFTAAQANAGSSAPQPDSMKNAMQRDLGLTESQATQRLAAEKSAATLAKSAPSTVGSSYAGSWFDADQNTLVVAATDATAAKKAAAAGAKTVTVARTLKQLDGYVADLADAKAPKTVADWYVDVTTNKVVVSGSDAAAAKTFATQAGVPSSAVETVVTRDMPQPLLQGGDEYVISNAYLCSVGFAVNGGFVTAGHCGTAGETIQPSGTFSASSFPGNDYAYVKTPSAVSATVNNYSGGSVAVKGSTDAPVGSSLCRSGRTTGWHCGTIQARGATVNYAEGSVTGLIRTNACAEGGDSGGSAISGNQAQGVTSGGSGNCTSGGTTYFQPVNEILNAYGLTLRTS